MFIAIVSRPDIIYAIGMVSRFLNKHNTSHWNAVKRIIRYLKSTPNTGIKYGATDSKYPNLIGYSDSDFANDPDTRKSTSGYIFKLNGGAVTWSSQRQQTVSLSTSEAEYIGSSNATKEAIWVRRLLQDLGELENGPTTLCVDNQSAIRLVKNAEHHKRTKHIDIKYHFVREKYENGEVNIIFVPSKEQLADITTKPLSKDQFNNLKSQFGMVESEMK